MLLCPKILKINGLLGPVICWVTVVSFTKYRLFMSKPQRYGWSLLCVICVDQKPPSQLNRPYLVPLTWCASIASQKPRAWTPCEVSCREFAALLPLWTCVSCCYCQISLTIWADTGDNIPAGVLVNTPLLNKSTVAQINYLYTLFGNCSKMKLCVS